MAAAVIRQEVVQVIAHILGDVEPPHVEVKAQLLPQTRARGSRLPHAPSLESAVSLENVSLQAQVITVIELLVPAPAEGFYTKHLL